MAQCYKTRPFITAVSCTPPPPHNFAATGLLCLFLLLALIVPIEAYSQTTNAFWGKNAEALSEGGTYSAPLQFTQNITTQTSMSVTVSGTATHGTDYTFGTGVTYANGTATVTIPAGTQRFTIFTFDINILADSASDNGETLILTIDATSTIGRGNPHVYTITITEDTGTATYEIRGDPHVGEVLTLHKTMDDPDGGVAVENVSWSVPKEGQGSLLIQSGGTSFTPTVTQLGFPMQARIVYTDGNGNTEDIRTNIIGPIRSARPRVVDILRQGSSPTAADSLTWRVRFNELVKDVDAADFSLSGSTAVLSVLPVAGDANAWDVTARGGNLAHFNGMVTLSFASGQDIKDADDVDLRDTTPTGTNEPTFVVNNPPGVTVSPTSLALTELGTSSTIQKTYTLVLATDPGADVTLTVANGDATAVAVDTNAGTSGNQNTLTFTHGNTGNWGTAQTITVRALNDGDGANESFNITHTATAASGPYNGIAIDPLAVTLTDAGHGVVVSESSVSVADNDETATYTVVLKSQPSGNVVIAVTSGGTGTATVSSGAVALAATSGVTAEVDTDPDMTGNQNTLTFTPSDWNIPQPVTITGKGAEALTIRHAVQSSADTTNYPTTLTIPSVVVTVTSTATPGVTLTETGTDTVVSEDGSSTDSYDLVLESAPTHDVKVTVSAGSGVEVRTDGGTSYASSQTLTFTTTSWNTARTITVRGVDDGVDNAGGGRNVTITHATTSTDPDYDNLLIADAEVRVTDVIVADVTVSKETVALREGRSETYTLVLTSTPQTNVVISITARDPAIAEVAPKRLTFTPQNARTPQTVIVQGVADDRVNTSPRTTVIEHVVVTTNDPDYRAFSIASITVMVEDDATLEQAGRATSAGLTRFGRTVGQQAVAAVRDRVGADRTRGFVSRLAGETLPRIAGTREASERVRDQVDGFGHDENADVTRALSEEDVLGGTSFVLNTLTADGTSLAFWGRGSISEFRGTAEGLFLAGDVREVMMGADRLKDARLMGVMAMGSRGDITYRFGDDTGRLETALTALVPYGRRDFRNGMSFWGAVGVGWGTLTLTPEGRDPLAGPLDWHMAAGGIEGRLSGVALLPEADLGWHTDALWTRTRSEPTAALPALGGTTTRVRLGVDATWPEAPALKGLVSPHAGVGIRYDGGDAETGFGLEIEGGVTWRDPESHLSLSVEGRTLAVHEERAFRDWGMTFGLVWDPRPDTKEGFSATFGYDLGHGTSGEDALLGPETYPGQNEAEGETSWHSEVAYGVSRGGGLVGSPYGGIGGTSETIDEARVGYRIEPDTPHAENMSVDVWTDPVAEDEKKSAGAGLMWRW